MTTTVTMSSKDTKKIEESGSSAQWAVGVSVSAGGHSLTHSLTHSHTHLSHTHPLTHPAIHTPTQSHSPTIRRRLGSFSKRRA